MSSKKQACIIVDPFVSPRIICEALLSRGIAPIALITDCWSNTEWKRDRLQEAVFEKIVECYSDDQMQSLPSQWADYNIVGFIYGREGESIKTADRIAHELFPIFSNPGSSEPRANKFDMLEACRKRGVNSVEQARFYSEKISEDEKAYLEKLLPVIVKPTQSSGSQGVTLCNNLEEVLNAVKNLLNQNTIAGKTHEVVVQKKLEGEEYCLDSVSWNNQYFPCAVYCYNKTIFKGHVIYRSMEIIDHHTDEARTIIEYTKDVLSAVKFKNGLAHTECFLKNGNPCLIEINARISGAYGYANKMGKIAYKINQAELFADLLLGKKPKQLLSTKNSVDSHVMVLFLQCWRPRKIGKFQIDKIKQYSSYCEHLALKPEGTEMRFPKYLSDTVAFVMLANKNRESLYEDAQAIFDLELAEQLF